MDVSPSLPFFAGKLDGTNTVLFGARVEIGKEVASAKLARVAVVGDTHAGNGMATGFGLGVRGELGSKKINVYGSIIPQINMGIGMNGATAAIPTRGNLTVNVVPVSGAERTATVPPCAFTTCSTM